MTRGWFDDELQRAVKAEVAKIEARTSAEVVVAVRPISGDYRATDLSVGLVIALLVLCVFLYHPAPFDFTWLPLELIASFALGAVLARSVAPLRRALTSRKRRRLAAEQAARAAFVDLGVSRTRGRTGVLVFVSAFERCGVVLADLGVPQNDAFKAWRERVTAAIVAGKPPAFLEALAASAPMLEEALPRAEDDENELADGMQEVAS